MIFSENLLAFVAASAIIEATPGPNMTYLVALSATEGRRAGIAAVAGVALGLLLIGLLCAFGLGFILVQSEIALEILRWTGIIYLIWLAWDALAFKDADQMLSGSVASKDIKYFQRGLITNLLNPKAILFYISILPEFILPNSQAFMQTILLTLIYVMVATLVHGGLVGFAGVFRPWLVQSGRRRWVQRVFALALLMIAVWFGMSNR